MIRNHQCLIAKQSRKYARTHHWKPLIVKELTSVQVIVWYIMVELLRTKQVPPYLTYSRMHMVPSLKSDIEKQASSVYSTMYRHDDNINKFLFADTNDDQLDGKVGVISYYDASTSCYQAKLCQSTDVSVENIPVLTENMEPHRKICTSTYVPVACKESFQVSIQNHFPSFRDTTPSVVFRSDVFRSIGGLTRRPDRGGNGAVERLIKLIEEREAKENEELEKVRLQSVELEKNLSRLHSTRLPMEQRPRKKIRDRRKMPKESIMVQIRSVWKAKIQHYVSQQVSNNFTHCDYREEDHLFTYPFTTSDNSLHSCSDGLSEFSELRKKSVFPDAVYVKENLVRRTVIDATSVRSLAPGQNVTEDVMDFCLSW